VTGAGEGPSVRPATIADAAAIAEVHVASWRTTYAGIVPRSVLDGLSVERRRDGWTGRLADPGEARAWVGELDGRVVGFVGTGRPTAPELPDLTGELESIYLLDSAQGRGLGGLLVRTALADLRERGFSTAILWVLTANATARRFYETLGWAPDGSSQMLDFDGTPIEEIRYRIDL
jgi:GNAT superfamily N-acetyltransferase